MTQPGVEPNPDNIGVGTQEEVDWQARAEAAEQEAQRWKKEADDARSQRIGALKGQARDEMLVELHNTVTSLNNRFGGVEKSLGLVIDGVVDGDTEKVRQQYQRLQDETRQTQAETAWTSYYNARAQEFLDLVKDEDGQNLLDIDRAPELEQVREEWLAAKEIQDRAGIALALSQTKDVVYQLKLERLRQGTPPNGKGVMDNAPTETETGEDQDADEGDLFSTMDTGKTSGGRGVFGSWDQVLNAYLSGRIDARRYDTERARFGK